MSRFICITLQKTPLALNSFMHAQNDNACTMVT